MSGISLLVLSAVLAVFPGNQQPRTRNPQRMTAPSHTRSRSLLPRRTRLEPTGGYTTPLMI
jgi:hypothetical protein